MVVKMVMMSCFGQSFIDFIEIRTSNVAQTDPKRIDLDIRKLTQNWARL